MSAIWGCIDFSGAEIEESIPEHMSECIKKYKIDSVNQVLEKNIYMACGLQYITAESKREKVPFVCENIFFTADCIIDNRQELISKLLMDENATDSEILFMAWRQWGKNFGEHVIGLFSFALFDQINNEFYLFTDHTASRCVHYYTIGDRVYFATLTASITDAVENISINEKWMTACMTSNFPSMLLFPGLTPFDNIYIVQYGCGVKITKKNRGLLVKDIRYWNPLKTVKQIKKFDDKQCRKMFRDTFFQCVKDALRTDGNIGILLSSGLDSSAIGGISAKLLKAEGKKLNSYTSIVLKEFDVRDDNEDGYWIDDESEGVECLCKYYDNISANFLECRGKSVLTYIEDFCDYLEFPGKALINHVWMKDAYYEAKNDGCKIVLSGGYGNWTISNGSIEENVRLMIRQGDILGAIKQLKIYADKERYIKRKYILDFFKDQFKHVNYSNGLLIDNEYYKADLTKKYHIAKEWKKRLKREGKVNRTISQRRNALVAGLLFQLKGMYETKDGLYNGIVVRDPSKDKRIIELCLRMPFKSNAWDGVDRRLIREYLADIVPDSIRLIDNRRGRQSGDAVYRYERYGLPNGNDTWDELIPELEEYFNIEKAKDILKEKTDNNNINIKSKILACNYFLKKWYK